MNCNGFGRGGRDPTDVSAYKQVETVGLRQGTPDYRYAASPQP